MLWFGSETIQFFYMYNICQDKMTSNINGYQTDQRTLARPTHLAVEWRFNDSSSLHHSLSQIVVTMETRYLYVKHLQRLGSSLLPEISTRFDTRKLRTSLSIQTFNMCIYFIYILHIPKYLFKQVLCFIFACKQNG